MPDREKVIRGLECCLSGPMQCDSCPYKQPDEFTGGCAQELKGDAIALLREQEPVKPEHGFPDLKCPNCGTEFVDELRYYLGKKIAEYYMYCPGCGRKVKWDGDS